MSTPNDWRAAILKDIKEVPRLGTPGGIVTYGPKAAPILTGPNADGLISAAELGSGRALCFPQGSYVKEFIKTSPAENLAQLVKNVKEWVSRGTVEGKDGEVFDLNKVYDFDKVPKEAKILLWHDNKDRTDTFYNRLESWVKAGGGLVYGMNPWGYLSLHPDRTTHDIPQAQLLRLTGACFSTLYMSGSGPLIVEDNRAADAHVLDIIATSKKDISHLVDYRKVLETSMRFMSSDGLEEIIPSLTAMITTHTPNYHSLPSKAKPVTTPEGRALASLMNYLYLRVGQFNGNKTPPGADEFPGDFPTPPPAVGNQDVTVKATGRPVTYHPTGAYVPPGSRLQVVLKSPSSVKGWTVLVGAHRDQLYNKETKWRRWPSVHIQENLTSEMDILNVFGGLVYLKSPTDSTEEVTVTLKNVVKAPYFDVKVPDTITDWEKVKKEPGLWVDLCGEALRITMPASSIRQEKSPKEVLELWDSVVGMHVDLRGLHKAKGRREWVVTDQQPSAGYMHSGYPIVTQLDVADPDKPTKFLLSLDDIKKNGRWGVFHELGHNMQDKMWTFSGTGEVTCNIFSMHAMERVTGQKPWVQPWLKSKRDKMEKYLKAGAKFADWKKDPGVALAIYGQLARDMGWAVYKKVFREYDALDESEKPKTDDEKIDQWIERFSKNEGKNLCPMFDFWGFPIRDEVLKRIKHLPAFLHDDETTKDMAPDRAEAIRKKYGINEEELEDIGLCVMEEEE